MRAGQTLVYRDGQHPHYLAYFNELAGGSTRGYRYLADSNLDWGQDLKLLANFIDQASHDVYYSYFGAAVPARYGIDRPSLAARQDEPLNFAPANPAPGLYALSVSHLQGMGLDFTAHPFPDHPPFAASDLEFAGADAVLMTEKDAVKCIAYADEHHWALRVDAQVDPALGELVLSKLDSLLTTHYSRR